MTVILWFCGLCGPFGTSMTMTVILWRPFPMGHNAEHFLDPLYLLQLLRLFLLLLLLLSLLFLSFFGFVLL